MPWEQIKDEDEVPSLVDESDEDDDEGWDFSDEGKDGGLGRKE